MYPGAHALARAQEPVQIMGRSGETLTYAEYEARANRLAHWLRRFGLKRLDHFAVFMENHPRFIECGAAGDRAGLYYTYCNCYLTAEELAYLLDNSESQVVITSAFAPCDGACRDERGAARKSLPRRRRTRRRRTRAQPR